MSDYDDFTVRTTITYAPFHDFVVVQHPDPERVSEQGIILDQAHSLVAEAVPFGTIVAVGPEVPDYVSPGMVVLLEKYTGSDIVVDDEKYTQYRWRNVTGAALFREPPSEE